MRQIKYRYNKAQCILHTSVVLIATLCSNASTSKASHPQQYSFQRISTFGTYRNNTSIGQLSLPTSLAASKDGFTLGYIDKHNKLLGLIDISNPSKPNELGTMQLAGTPVAIRFLDKYVVTTINIATSVARLDIIDPHKLQIIHSFNLHEKVAQMDISPLQDYLVVSFQSSNTIKVIKTAKTPKQWISKTIHIPGLADNHEHNLAINDSNQVVVTLPASNEMQVVNLRGASNPINIKLGITKLTKIDNKPDGIIEPIDAIYNTRRYPQAVTWLSAQRIAIANKSSRSFSVYDLNGYLRFDSKNQLEKLAIAHGHFPEHLANQDGAAPSLITHANYQNQQLLFVGSDKGNYVSIYKIQKHKKPKFIQFIPGPLKTSDIVAIPNNNLLVLLGNYDAPTLGIRSTIMIYQYTDTPNASTQIASKSLEQPIAWSALSGLSATQHDNRLLAIWDKSYVSNKIFTIDTSHKNPKIVDSIELYGNSEKYDLEGITIAPDTTAWIASEGSIGGERQNLIAQVNPTTGRVIQEVPLPSHIAACVKNSDKKLGGFHGITYRMTVNGYQLLVIQKSSWSFTGECNQYSDQPGYTKIWIYTPSTESWNYYIYELEKTPEIASNISLLEISRSTRGGELVVVEADNRTGDFASLKRVHYIPATSLSDNIVNRNEKQVFDLIPFMKATHGWINHSPEGLAITPNGSVYLVTDNQAQVNWSGETQFLNLGQLSSLFPVISY